ncbi:T6SS effector amidase Tae4 family protein [Sphingomonas montana]|uniref:T6SS effector amidase Tae4 family protein n=1 Tax=Sphingomonas montana TaxID=1843236 RepID=UPI00096FA387|nr:T6SS effector amidase Tae4 family protein [Sphingomonas montana]
MAKPSFRRLWSNYPRGSPENVLRGIGWDDLIGNPNYENTCAIRMSICLAASGQPVRSSQGMKVLSGPLKGLPIEVRQDTISRYLEQHWGPPLKVAAREAEQRINGRDGVASFFGISGYNVGGRDGGHIDLIDGTVSEHGLFGYVWSRSIQYSYGSHGYMDRAASVWFWEMPR